MPLPNDGEDPEEAEAWAAMRAAFADDEEVKASEKSSPQEADALRKAEPAAADGGDDDVAAAAAGAAKTKVAAAPKWSAGPAAGGAAKAGTGAKDDKALFHPRAKPTGEVDGDDISEPGWLQKQVDRLVGEVQRHADGPFSPSLLKDLWSIPLEDQHELLLGALGSQGALFEKKDETGKRLWQVIEEEVRARGGWSTPAPPSKPATTAPARTNAAGPPAARRGAPSAPRAPSRSRSRSLSL